MDLTEASRQIVQLSRKARFADTTMAEWTDRLSQLIAAQPGLSDPTVTDVRPVGTAAGGSNGTLLFNASWQGPDGPERRGLVLRFLPAQGLFHDYNLKAQFELQSSLHQTAIPVPGQLWLDVDGKYLVRPGYVMEQCEGTSPAMAWITDGIIADATPAERRTMTSNYVRTLAQIHSLDWREIGLQWLEGRAEGTKPIEREVNWYWDGLLWCKDKEYKGRLAPIRDWLIANEPADCNIVLCHGDANLGNYLFKGTEISAVLDWEMAFLGAPEADLVYLAIGDRILMDGLPRPEGVLSPREMYAEYEHYSGRKLGNIEYFELFTYFRLAIINVLCMKHFSPEVRGALMPIMARGPELCFESARSMGIRIEELS